LNQYDLKNQPLLGFRFLTGGATIGLLLMEIMSRMMSYVTWTASPLRFLAGFVMSLIYHANRCAGKSFFKVAHYRMDLRLDNGNFPWYSVARKR